MAVAIPDLAGVLVLLLCHGGDALVLPLLLDADALVLLLANVPPSFLAPRWMGNYYNPPATLLSHEIQ